jgi:hypothetical protein
MNTDHRDSHVPLLTHFLGRTDATTDTGRYPLRLPFPQLVTTSEEVRKTIVAMLKQARGN